MDLKANTAVDVLIGVFVDDTDGNTAETGLTLAQADILLSKNGQALTQKNDVTSATHDSNGYYNCELDATDTNTEGNLVLVVHEPGALPVRHEFNVLSEAAWDSLYAAKDTGYMDVNISSIDANAITASAINGDAITSAKIADGAFVAANFAASSLDGKGDWNTVTPDAAGVAPTANEVRNAVTGGAYALDTDANGRMRIVDGIAAGELDTDSGTVLLRSATETQIDNIEADTNELQTDDIPSTLSTIEGKVDTIDTNIDQVETAVITNAAGVDISADVAAVKAETANIVADTNELQTDNIPGTLSTIEGKIDTVDSNVDTVLIDTNSLNDTKIPDTLSLANINGEVDTALNTAIPGSPTLNSINDYIERIKKNIINKMEITEASGNTIIYDNNGVSTHVSVNAAFTSDATTTTREALE